MCKIEKSNLRYRSDDAVPLAQASSFTYSSFARYDSPSSGYLYALHATSHDPEFSSLESPSFKNAFDPGLLSTSPARLSARDSSPVSTFLYIPDPGQVPEDTIWPKGSFPSGYHSNNASAGATFCNANSLTPLLTASKDIINREIRQENYAVCNQGPTSISWSCSSNSAVHPF